MRGEAIVTAAATQEANRQTAKVERALDRARDWHDRVKGELGTARKAKKALRVIELEAELAQAADALNAAACAYETVCGVPAPLSATPQPKPGTVMALCAANPELRAAYDEISRCERRINVLRPQVERIEKVLAAQGGVFVSPATSENSAAETTLDVIYPERVGIRASNSERLLRGNQNDAQLRKTLAELKNELATIEGDLAKATAKRDALLPQTRAAAK
jgi:hypothetical protein